MRQCDGEFPCKRCKDDGLVCTAGTRKKTEFKQLPRGYAYILLSFRLSHTLVANIFFRLCEAHQLTMVHRYAEVLENTQFALIATVHKLYSMVRSGQQWDLEEPDLNDRGQPVIHDIAQKLGCIRPNSDIDLPVHSVFPEDEQGLADLARQLEAQQQQDDKVNGLHDHDARTDRASSSDLDHSDFEDYRKAAFGGGGPGSNTTLSPASLTYDSFDNYSAPSTESLPSATSPTNPVPTSFAPWMRPASMGFNSQFIQQSGAFAGMDMLNQGLLESEFGTIKPHVVSCPNPEVMMGLGDPMIYAGFDPEAMRL